MSLEFQHIKEGGQKAFRDVFDRYFSGMVEYAYRYLYNQAASEDLVQEVFIDLWVNRNTYQIKTSLKGYLYTTVRNRCLNHLKSIEVTDKDYLMEINFSLSVEQPPSFFEEEEVQAMREKAHAILQSLPEKMGAVFRLKMLEGYTYAQIAEELDISVNTVKTQLKRARERITRLHEIIILFWVDY